MITFPVTMEAFIADQEQLMGRKLQESEREAVVIFVEIFNSIYEDGLRQDCAILVKDLDDLDEFKSRHKDDSFIHQFVEACRFWMAEAWKQGAAKAKRNGVRV
ncbi:hypothetical protein ADH75_18510 [Flavonifractor plautii]|uniref:Uncharacterized protein n=1 Tax=Flavonifractor plautii TaxID=292800 RepID=A0AAX1KLL2_FLAPL|nr:hypothetical protein [Flavonifractor plautii]WAK79722.1 hypothetical protein [Flavonifractor phage Castelnaud]ANU40430.1 hypothetical protein A4U99_04835 [Flavonifractor plautii]OXE44125.1 hypothetical protein ADH75_18510 [Flavonifractor plautii]QQR06861.1 hypothetical protein I5Q84_05085 [Flavonifractor plautii]UQA27565.1 hypothetical protein M2853_04735 [Flavonifractor plautii]